MVAYYEDLYREDPYAQLDAMRGEDGEIVLDDIGDPLLDKWERELAQGLEPDLEEGLSDRDRERLKQEREKAKKGRETAKEAIIDDDFTKERDVRKYESKMVAVGSPEDRALLRGAALGNAQTRRRPEQQVLGGALKRGR